MAGLVTFLALVAYLAVGFATAHISVAASGGRIQTRPQQVGPWTARTSNLIRVPRTRGAGLAVRVTPVSAGLYGVEIKELALTPALRRRFALDLSLRASRLGRVLVQINHGSASPMGYLVQTTVVAGRKWRRFTYSLMLEGGGNRIGLFVGQRVQKATGPWFEIRGLSLRSR